MNYAIEDTAVIQRAAGKIAAEMGDETVILDIASGQYFQLNRVGARIWGLIEAPIAFAALCEGVMATFAIDAETCRADVAEFIRTAQGRGLIEIV